MKMRIRLMVPIVLLLIGGMTAITPTLSLAGCRQERPPDSQRSGSVDVETTSEAVGAPAPLYTPKTGQHGLIIRCAGGRTTPENPLSVNRQLLNDPERFFELHTERALKLHEITGNARIVFHMLNGWDREGMWHSAAVLDAMPPDRRSAFEKAVRTLTKAGVTVGTYSGSKVPAVIDSVRIADVGDAELFDYDNPRHRKTMMAIFEPLIELGVTEIWVDNSSRLRHRQDWVKMAEDLREKGAYFVMEAIPATGTRPRDLDVETASRVASVGWDRYIYLRTERHDNHWFPLPENTEFIVVISGHQTIDDTVPPTSDSAARQDYLAERTALRLRQGLSVFNMQQSNDEAFFELVRRWTEGDGSFSNGISDHAEQ